jgi:methyl-accepting chemotaxis protein
MANWRIIILLILSFFTGIFAGYLLLEYFLLGNSTFSGVAQWIGGSLTAGWIFDLITSVLRDARQEKQVAHAKAIEQLIKHTEDLKPMLKELEKEPLFSSDEFLFSQTKKHIETGYPELWNLLEGNNGIIKVRAKYFDLKKQLLTQIETLIKKRVQQSVNFSEIDWSVEDIKDSIERKVSNNKIRKFRITESISTDSSVEKRRTFLVFGEADKIKRTYMCENLTEKDKTDLSEILNNIIDDAELQKQFEDLNDLIQQYNNKRQTFIKKLHEIIDYIKHATNDEDKKLLGKCKYCEVSKKSTK